MDSTKRNFYYKSSDSKLPDIIETLKGKTVSKIPGASFLFEPSVDNWGRSEGYGNVFERITENTISPGYYSEENYTAVDNEIKRLYDQTGESDVFPKTQQKSYVEKGVVYNLDAKQFTEAKTIRGKKSFELAKNLIYSNAYVKMTDEQKVKALSKVYQEAGEYAKQEMLKKLK